MKKVLRKNNLGKCILALVLFASVFVFAGDVVVKEGLIEGEKFQSTGCSATGAKAVALGYDTEASGYYSTAMGYKTTASLSSDTAMGYNTEANGGASTAMGCYTSAIGMYSTAMGSGTTASGNNSTAMGSGSDANGTGSTAMGYYTTASGDYSTATGYGTIASGSCSTAMGWDTTASGALSIAAGGDITTASGDRSFAMGFAVRAGPANDTTAFGKNFINNVADSFAVGYGQKDFSVQSGQVNVYGDLEVDDDLNVKGTYKANGTSGWSGWFDDGANFRVTVTNGIITNVTDSVSAGHNP